MIGIKNIALPELCGFLVECNDMCDDIINEKEDMCYMQSCYFLTLSVVELCHFNFSTLQMRIAVMITCISMILLSLLNVSKHKWHRASPSHTPWGVCVQKIA